MVLMVPCLRSRVLKIFTDVGFKTFDVMLWKQFALVISLPEMT